MPELKDLIERLPAGVQTNNWSASRTPVMVTCENHEFGYRCGHIDTAHGIVGLYDQQRDPYTSLNIVIAGRDIRASWRRCFTDRYLKTLARRFAEAAVKSLEQQPWA